MPDQQPIDPGDRRVTLSDAKGGQRTPWLTQ